MNCKKFIGPMTRRRLKKLSIFTGAALMLLAFLTKTALWITNSESLEGRAFLVLKGASYGRGDIIGIQDFELPNHSRMPHLLKKVMGLPGDKVSVRDNKVFINDLLIGPLFKETSTGNPLIPIQHQIIPDHCLFLSGTHPRSFDSRYLEFGLLCLRNDSKTQGFGKILGRALRII
jgi:hypothetical protein